MTEKFVVMIGSELSSPGGISAVAKTYKDSGLFEKANVKYLGSYDKPNKLYMLFKYLRCFFFLLKLLIFKEVSCVHVHSASRGSFWRKAALLELACFFGVRTIFHLHSGEFNNFYSSQIPRIQKFISKFLSKVDVVIALTETWRKFLLDISPTANVEVVFNPVEEISRNEQKIVNQILFLGRLRDTKGLFELINACEKLKQQNVSFKLVLAGDGNIDEIRSLCADKGLLGLVRLPGWVDGLEKERLLLESDIFVLPSYFEGLPIGVLEAMINRIAVVATNVGGIPDVITDAHEGLLVEPRDCDGLTGAIKKLLLEPELKDKYIKNAYCRAKKHFTSESVNSSLIKLYKIESET